MTVREMRERLDAMVRDCPWLLDAEVCVRNDEFMTWSQMDAVEDVNVVRNTDTGSRFLGIGMKPVPEMEDYEAIWPEDQNENRQG